LSQVLNRLLESGPPLREDAWSLGRPALESVLAEVDAGRHVVVECGSGLSTILIARRLRELDDGHVHSLEHDEGFSAACRRQLERESLTGLAEVIEAPLRPHPASGIGWYDRDALAMLPAAGVQLLLIDGPPAGTPELERSRYPALGELRPRLVPEAVVICDDARRPGERWALERWRSELGFAYELGEAAGIARGTLE
jgi:predicted O-methyltransferase YrrM